MNNLNLSDVVEADLRETIKCDQCDLNRICEPVQIGEGQFDMVSGFLELQIEVPRGEYLFRRGEPAAAVYAVCAGSFKLMLTDGEGRERIVGYRIAGELIGTDVFHGGCRCVNAQALEPSRVCIIDYRALSHLGERVPAVQRRIMKMISDEVRQEQRAAMWFMGRKSAEELLAAFLLNMAERHREHGFSDQAFRLCMNRDEIGNYLGLAKETVSRLFIRFGRQGFVDSRGKHIRLTDAAGLRRMLGETGCVPCES